MSQPSLINQAKLTAVLYLENNLTPRVFTPTRITVLKLLASQAAISLENTRLYRDLEKREAKIRRLVEANVVGIVMWTLEGAIIEAGHNCVKPRSGPGWSWRCAGSPNRLGAGSRDPLRRNRNSAGEKPRFSDSSS